MRYLVIVEQGETSWGAHVPDLPGCVAVAESKPKVIKLIREAVDLHLDGLKRSGSAIPKPCTVEYLRRDFCGVGTSNKPSDGRSHWMTSMLDVCFGSLGHHVPGTCCPDAQAIQLCLLPVATQSPSNCVDGATR